MMSKLKSSSIFRKSSEATCLLSLWHPAYRQRDLITGDCVERENLSSRCKEKTSSKRHYERESIEACHGGGTFRSSEETSVMGVERRGSITGLSISRRKLIANRVIQEVRK
ncbi:hypothetical protein [Membranihabitans maritimus]|uniref:hypothetical protein n=1 Tax=Membranihabitans maritimus TaxID=2904244 RepID=UPI001F490D24|nr:hypothetical protein [Membranihabitans maritimus]